MGRKLAVLLVVGVVLGVLGPETSLTRALGGRPFQVLLNADGSGRIFMNNGARPSWNACRPDLTGCTPFAKGNFDTGNAPPETVFWAGGELSTPLWKGNLHEEAPPSVQGEVRGNKIVTPIAGQWAGGWADDYDALSLSICKTPAGEHCLQIDYELVRGGCGPRGAALIDPIFAGRYLQVVDYRYGSGTIFAGVGHPAYYPIPKVEPQATVSVAVVGKIAPATGPPKKQCGPPPLSTASIATDGSAEVTCQIVGCRATLIAQHGGKTVRVRRKLPLPPAYRLGTPVKLRLTHSALEQLGGGPLRIEVRVNGSIAARRTVKMPR
jgi:hypothetical protein